MGFFDRLQKERQKELLDFVNAQEMKDALGEKSTLSDVIRAEIVGKIIADDCHITGSATDHKHKKMWVEFTFYAKEEEHEEETER